MDYKIKSSFDDQLLYDALNGKRTNSMTDKSLKISFETNFESLLNLSEEIQNYLFSVIEIDKLQDFICFDKELKNSFEVIDFYNRAFAYNAEKNSKSIKDLQLDILTPENVLEVLKHFDLEYVGTLGNYIIDKSHVDYINSLPKEKRIHFAGTQWEPYIEPIEFYSEFEDFKITILKSESGAHYNSDFKKFWHFQNNWYGQPIFDNYDAAYRYAQFMNKRNFKIAKSTFENKLCNHANRVDVQHVRVFFDPKVNFVRVDPNDRNRIYTDFTVEGDIEDIVVSESRKSFVKALEDLGVYYELDSEILDNDNFGFYMSQFEEDYLTAFENYVTGKQETIRRVVEDICKENNVNLIGLTFDDEIYSKFVVLCDRENRNFSMPCDSVEEFRYRIS